MEQQNQQPIQEDSNVNRDFQPPKKSLFANKRLYLFIAVVAVVLTVGGILLLQMKSSSESDQPTVQQTPAPGAQTPSPKPSYDKTLYEG